MRPGVWAAMWLAGVLAVSTVAAHPQLQHPDDFSAQGLSDLGDAWLRAGHPGHAILQYERALVLAPQNPTLEQSLAQARGRAGIEVAPATPWSRATGVLGDDSWAWSAALFLLVLCTGLGLLAFGRGGRWAKALALAGACGTMLAGDVIALRWQDLDRAVVLQGHTAVRIAPADAAETSFGLREGETVYLEDRYQDYERVRTDDGRGGWVRQQSAVPVRVTLAQSAAEEQPP